MVAALRAAIGPTKKLVAVLIHGGTMAFPNATLDALDAVLDAWYPGLGGGEAVAATLFGDQSPAGRSSQTWYSSNADLPDQSKGYMVSTQQRFFLFQHAVTPSRTDFLSASNRVGYSTPCHSRDSIRTRKMATHTA
jgi:beta-glucosidase